MPSHVDRYIASRPECVHRIVAIDATGRQAIYFVLIDPAREKAFLAALANSETTDLEDHGKVLASCYGAEPDERVKALLLERYGFSV